MSSRRLVFRARAHCLTASEGHSSTDPWSEHLSLRTSYEPGWAREGQKNIACGMGILGSPVLGVEHVSSARVKMDELLVCWASQKETAKLLRGYLEAVAADQPLEKPGSSLFQTLSSSPSSSSSLPLSPRSPSPLKSPATGPAGLSHRSPTSKGHWSSHLSPRSERFERFLSPEKRSPSRSSGVSEESARSRPPEASRKVADEGRAKVGRDDIPHFWVRGEGGRGRGRPIPRDSLEARRQEMERLFERHPEGLGVDDFVPVTKTLCGFPSFFNAVLYKRLFARSQQAQSLAAAREGNETSPEADDSEAAPNGPDGADDLPPDARIPLPLFQEFWEDEIEAYDHVDRFFRLVKKPENEFIEKVSVSGETFWIEHQSVFPFGCCLLFRRNFGCRRRCWHINPKGPRRLSCY